MVKQYGFIYTNFKKMKSFIHSKDIANNDSILIQVFTGIIDINFAENLVTELLSLLPQAEILGVTAGGEIYEEKVLTSSTVISFTIFEKTKIKSILLNADNNNEYNLGLDIAKQLVEENTKVLILFTEGLLTDSSKIIEGIYAENNSVIVCGGKAADNSCFKETFVFSNEGVSKNGVVAASLTGKYLKAITDHSFGWSTIGKLMTITESSANKIFTIDNINAVDIYKKYLGEDIVNGLPLSAIEFPLIIKKDGIEIAKVPYSHYEDGSLSFLGNIETKDKIQFGYGSINILIDQSLEIATRLKNKNAEVIFIYSCSVRKAFLKDKIDLEISPLNDIAPTFGLFTYGEFFTFDNSNQLLNVTMTILGLSEDDQTFERNIKNISPSLSLPNKNTLVVNDWGTIKAFGNLVNQATKELEEANKTLEKQKSKIEQMNNITKSILQINTEMLSSGEFDDFLQAVLEKSLDIIPNGKMASILLLEDNRLSYKATKGYHLDKIKFLTYSIEELYHSSSSSNEELFNPKIIKDKANYLFHSLDEYKYWNTLFTDTPRELLTCGIGIDGQFMGLINIYNTDDQDNFNEDDKNLIKYLCYDIAIALRNAQLLEHILYMSKFDNLTGLYNRHYFREMLKNTASISASSKELFVLCILDLNNLKIINDTYGHDAGDEFIKTFARVFKAQLENHEIFARTGGDEFAVIFKNKTKDEIMKLMSSITSVIEKQLLNFNGNIETITFAYGLAEFPSDSENIHEILKIADMRMYDKKRTMKGL